METIFQNIKETHEVRQNLSLLRKELKEHPELKAEFVEYIKTQTEVLARLLSDEDAKVRKNVAALIGDLELSELMTELMEAYEKEAHLFVRPVYLVAMKNLDYREYVDKLRNRQEEMWNYNPSLEEQKHYQAERKELTELLAPVDGGGRHTFHGGSERFRMILLTNRNHKEFILKRLKELPNLDIRKEKILPAGIYVESNTWKKIAAFRLYQEILFLPPHNAPYESPKTDHIDDIADSLAKMVVESGVIAMLERTHEGSGSFYFRLDIKSLPDDKGRLLKKTASRIEEKTGRTLLNSASNYEVELRFVKRRDASYQLLIKLFTFVDTRFTYRKEHTSVSIRPSDAALLTALASEYLKEEGQVLDPFCGVGTMLIERHKSVAANTSYGIDMKEEAIEKAKINTESASQLIHYINKDFFTFTHTYLFDEIITNMPFEGPGVTRMQVIELIERFLLKSVDVLQQGGVLVLYTHHKRDVLKYARLHGYQLIKEFSILSKLGTDLLILKNQN